MSWTPKSGDWVVVAEDPRDEIPLGHVGQAYPDADEPAWACVTWSGGWLAGAAYYGAPEGAILWAVPVRCLRPATHEEIARAQLARLGAEDAL